MQRIPHDDQGFWLKEYKYIKTNPYVKKYYLDSASYILYSINIKLNESDELVITHPRRPPDNGLVNLYLVNNSLLKETYSYLLNSILIRTYQSIVLDYITPSQK